ncbi:MAG: GMC family oxidoreductase [Gemmatimonadota bacterium]
MEYLVVGSGFGGAFSALQLSKAGKEVAVIERGVWPDRDESCWDESKLYYPIPKYRGHVPILVDQREGPLQEVWPEDTVGGMSTMYGAAAYRFREEDFLGAPDGETGGRDQSSAWPVDYATMEPFYLEAERIQHVAGVEGEDITEPPRSAPFPQKSPELSRPSKRIWDAAEKLGLHPAHIPLAINFDGNSPGKTCIRCDTCDKFLCRIRAKNDLTVVALPEAMAHGAEIVPDTRVVRINVSGDRAVSVDVIHQSTGRCQRIKAEYVILSCGAVWTPYLLLVSGIRSCGGGQNLIGRGLLRHANSVTTGLSITPVNPEHKLHKLVWIPDFYHGHPCPEKDPHGPWGTIQQIHIPGRLTLQANSPRGLKTAAATASGLLMGLLNIAEDERNESNRVFPDPSARDKFGQPMLRVFHRYSPRDIRARKALEREARKILRRADAVPSYTYLVESCSHATGTCRFGHNRESSVLDPDCRVWGFENLFVVDASFMPSSSSLNPSLTIAANAIRVSRAMLNP